MTPKKQFSGTSRSRQFYDRKVRKQGESIIISMGKIIPHDWRYVRVSLLEKRGDEIIVRFYKLLGDEINTQTPKTH